MKYYPLKILLMAIIGLTIIFSGCSTPFSPSTLNEEQDSLPEITGIERLNTNSLQFSFNKQVSLIQNSFSISPELPVTVDSQIPMRLTISFDESEIPGLPYLLEFSVEDNAESTCLIQHNFYGFNPNPAQLRLNEIRLENSSTRPELVEFYCEETGNLGGLTVHNGMPELYKSRIILPDREVNAGDYVLVHFRPENILEEIDETESKSQSLGKGAHDNAWDYWVWGATGLSDSNGIIALTDTPAGPISEVFAWSSRSNDSDEKYGGFGTSYTQNIMGLLSSSSKWAGESDVLKPEDCFFPTPSTTTRTISRVLDSQGNKKTDWYICPTGQASFGDTNSLEVYVP